MLQERFIVLGKLEARIFEGLPKIIELDRCIAADQHNSFP